MRIVKMEDFQADGGWRTFCFLKITTDEGLVGWSEYNETYWSRGLTAVIRKLADFVIGQDPGAVGRLTSRLYATTRMTAGGLNHQAIAAIENACLDIKAKALGVPVYSLFGGPYRERIPVYWSHCGTFRARNADFFEKVVGTPPLRTLQDIKRLGEEVVARGFKALKTNPILFDGERPRMLYPGFSPDPVDLALNFDSRTCAAIAEQLAAFRDGIGPHTGLILDLNFSQKAEGLMRTAKALEPFHLTWLEMDMYEPKALALVRRSTATPVGSLEAIHGRRNYKPYFENYAVDVALIDVPWNGLLESVKIAAMAEAYEVNVAPHNFCGHLYTMINAHLAASIPNLRIMEFEVDDVPWKDDLVTNPPVIEKGELVLPAGPGWGTEVVEEALRAHPPK
jgi:galactonate dehydratase